MSNITVVCCYNNEKVYADFVKTLEAQSVPCELIGIDNTGNKRFSSCSAAYNSVIDSVKTKYVVYAHQDIILTDPDNLKDFVSCLERTGRNDIAGVAGVKLDTEGLWTDLKQIFKASGEFTYAGGLRVPNGMMECDIVDECFFGGHTEYFRDNPFDEVLCDGWHLYAAEQCLRTRGGGGQIHVCGISLVHLSDGTVKPGKSKRIVYPPSLYWTFFRLCRKYSVQVPFIRTTCISSKTDLLHALMKYARSIAKYFLARLGL